MQREKTPLDKCTFKVTVTDDASPPLSDAQTIELSCIDTAPAYTSAIPTSPLGNSAQSFDVKCVDEDNDPLTLAVDATDTCGGTMTDNGNGTGTYAFTVPAATGTCTLTVSCSDGYLKTFLTGSVSLGRPSFTSTPPSTVPASQQASYQIKCVDPDGDSLTITGDATDTCKGTVADNGDGTATYDFQGPAAGESCTIALDCSDGASSAQQSALVKGT